MRMRKIMTAYVTQEFESFSEHYWEINKLCMYAPINIFYKLLN